MLVCYDPILEETSCRDEMEVLELKAKKEMDPSMWLPDTKKSIIERSGYLNIAE